MNTTIILPAAGSGTRLGLSSPKELYEVNPGIKLIDFSLMHIKKYLEKYPGNKLSIAVVIKKEKLSVYEYVKVKFPEIKVSPVLFNDNYFEWAGSVYSANEYFSDNNIVLLPDSFIEMSAEDPFRDRASTLFDKILDLLKTSAVSFGVIPCKDKNKLTNLGALFLNEGKVLHFQDKPKDEYEKYNAFWTTYAFKKKSAHTLYEFLVRSIKHEKTEYEKELFYPAKAAELYSYTDLGTWEAIDNFKKIFIKKYLY